MNAREEDQPVEASAEQEAEAVDRQPAYAGMATLRQPPRSPRDILARVGILLVISGGAAVGLYVNYGLGPASLGFWFTSFIGGALIDRQLARQARKRFVDELGGVNSPVDFAAIQRACSVAPHLPRPALAPLLLRCEGCPRVVFVLRRFPDNDKVPLLKPPVAQAFAPAPLDEDDPQFRLLSGLPALEKNASAKRVLREIFVQIRQSIVLQLGLVVALVLAALLTPQWNALLTGRIPVSVNPGNPCCVSTAIILLWIGFRIWKPEQWLLIPGGIVVRRSLWRSGRWTLSQFSRKTCQLICWTDGVAVASEQDFATTRLTPVELEALLRAWFSDAPRPPLENMGDLR